MTQTSLRVQSTRDRTPRKSSEAQFERKIAKHIQDLGLHSYHTSERAFMGIPDRYVCGGRWIEFKQIAVVRTCTPMRLLSKSQQSMLTTFTKHGDDCFVCTLFQFQDCEPWCILMNWKEFIQIGPKWDRSTITDFGYQEKDWLSMLQEQGFRREEERKFLVGGVDIFS